MSTDAQELKKIKKMTALELLKYILFFPECLTDPYYRKFHTAIYARATQLGLY